MIGSYVSFMIIAALMMMGIDTGWLLVAAGFVGAIVIASAYGWSIERVAYRPVRNSKRLIALISAIGMSIFLQNYVSLTEGSRDVALPSLFNGQWVVGHSENFSASITTMQAVIWIVTFLAMLALTIFIRYSRMGRACRACAEDLKMASLLGINTDRVIALTFVIGAAMAAVAGVLLGQFYGVINPYIGFMAGMMRKLSNNSACVFTGKGLSFGGSLIRPEATGYGLVYFTEAMLKRHGMGFEGMRVSVSGSGNVAQYAIEKAMEFGARVITASDSSGTVVDESGFTKEKLARLIEIKASRDGRVADYAKEFGLVYLEGQQPWSVPVDIALPCATQNELDVDAAHQLIANGVKAVAEGANMPTTIEATELFQQAGVLFAPGKAANAGGVATSGLEMAQNAARLGWKAEKVDARLHHIMLDIHHACVEHGGEGEQTNYVQGANIAGFVKVADAMLSQGVI